VYFYTPTTITLSISHRQLLSIHGPVPSKSYLSPLSLHLSLEAHLGKHLRLKPLPPIYLFFSWTLALPVIQLDLAVLPRSSNSTYHKHIKAIIVDEISSHTLCYTDGSKSGTRTGYAFSINGVITHHRLRNSASIISAELLAIYSASLIFLSFPLHINSSSFPIPSPPFKRCRSLIHLTLLCSAYSSSFTLCPPQLNAPFSGSQGTSFSMTMTQ